MAEPQLQAGSSLDIHVLALSLLARWRVIVLAEAAALLAALALFAVMPTSYQSNVQLLVYDPNMPALSALGQEASSAREYDAVAMDSAAQVITSSSLALRVARDLDLENNVEFQVHPGLLKRLGGSVLARLGLAGPNEAGAVPGETDPANDRPSALSGPGIDTKTEQAAALLRNHLAAARIPLTYVMVVSAKSRTPQMARLLAATLVREYLADQREVGQQALGKMSDWLGEKLAQLKDQITETSISIEKLKLATGERGADHDSLTDQQVAGMNAQLMAVRADLAEKAARLEQVKRARNGGGWSTGAVDAMSSPVLTDLYLRRSNAARLRDQLAARLGARHANVVAEDAQLAALDRSVDMEAARAYGELQSSFDVATLKAASLTAGLERLKSTLADTGSKVHLQQLQQTAETQKEAYTADLEKLDRVESLRSLGADGQRIISPASLPSRPSSLPRNVIVAGLLALALAAASALILYRDVFQGSLRNMGRRDICLGRPVVSRIPFHERGLLVGDLFRADAEAARFLRMRLRGSGAHVAARVVLVTSTVAGEGRSTVSHLLAFSSVAARYKTLLLTCDAGAAPIWSANNRTRLGLIDILEGRAELHEAVAAGPGANCDMIAAGAAQEGAGDLLTSSRMTGLITQLREIYDYVVIDGPPAAAAGETLALADLADQILIVVDPGRSDVGLVAAALRLLDDHSERIAGLAFNDSGPKRAAEPARRLQAASWRSSIQGLRTAIVRAALAAGTVGSRRSL